MQLILIYNFLFNMLFIEEYYKLNIHNIQYLNFWSYFKKQISICQPLKSKIAHSYCTNSRNDFFWGQVCGIELSKYKEKFCYIATPVFETEYSSKGYYRSLIVKNKGNLKCVIFNNKSSYSGCTTLKHFIKNIRHYLWMFFQHVQKYFIQEFVFFLNFKGFYTIQIINIFYNKLAMFLNI